MTEDEIRFLAACRCALKGEPYNEHLRTAEYRQLFSLADSHHIFPMIFEAVYKGLTPQEKDLPYFRKNLQKAVTLTCRQARMTAEFLKLYRFLAGEGLHPVVLKGITNRALYLSPEERSSSDEDLLIPEERFPLYREAFRKYGLRLADPQQDIQEAHEVSYCSSKLYIELHKRPFPPNYKAYGDLNVYFEDTEEKKISQIIYGTEVFLPDHTAHLFYQLCHAYKHFLNCGIGIRIVSDIALYSMTYREQIDWETVSGRCKEIRAYDFVSALYRIADKHLFPESFPGRLREVWQTETADEEPLLEDILEGGLYGTSSDDRLHSANLTLHAAEEERSGTRSSVLLRTLFPSLSSMTGRYPYLRKTPFLLPFAWLQRITRYGTDSILRKRKGHQAAEAVRIGSERVALLRKYKILEETKPSFLERIGKH